MIILCLLLLVVLLIISLSLSLFLSLSLSLSLSIYIYIYMYTHFLAMARRGLGGIVRTRRPGVLFTDFEHLRDSHIGIGLICWHNACSHFPNTQTC